MNARLFDPSRRHGATRWPFWSLALLLVCASLAGVPVAPADAADCTVRNGNDGGAQSLRALLAGQCITITFAPEVAQVTLATRLEISRNVTIQGPGAEKLTVRYAGPTAQTGNVFGIGQGAVTLRGLTIAGGRTTGNWGAGLLAIGIVTRLTITLDGVTLTDNIAQDGGGGGIYASNADLTLRNSTISGNQALGAYAGDRGGAGLFLDDIWGNASAALTQTTIAGNETPNNDGGGIRVWDRAAGRTATLTLNGSTVSGNLASDGGGIASDGGAVTATNSTFSGNAANANGGGINGRNGSVALKFVTIVGNIAEYDDDGGLGGGLAHYGGGTFTVLGSIVAGNRRGPRTLEDCAGTITSQGRNIWGKQTGCPATNSGDQILGANENLGAVLDPTLANNGGLTLVNNGGPTKTHNLVAGGPAVDQGGTADCPETDQRGVARPQGAACDIGAVELAYVTLTIILQGPEVVTFNRSYARGTVATIDLPENDIIITGWTIDGQFQGWAKPLTITMDREHTVVASYGSLGTFVDARPSMTGATEAIAQLAARGIVKGCDQAANLFCPTDPTLRAQMAALIVRALGWGGENPANPFPDREGVDDELWRAVAILADHGVAKGYGDGTYGTTSPVLNAQVISFITRAMVNHGYWTFQPDDGSVYPNVAADSGHRQDLVTYVHYAGVVRGTTNAGDNFVGWDQPSSRAYFAFALWQALDSYFKADRVP